MLEIHYRFVGIFIFKNMKKLTTEQFIEKARKIHGNKYDYSKIVYINSNTKICIICPEHGEFWQTPNKHLYGRGCNNCKGGVKPDGIEVIKKIKKILGDAYIFDEVEYINSRTPLKIKCKKHGYFYKTPTSILNKKNPTGCQLCRRKFENTEEFLNECIKLQNNIDYSDTEYISMRMKSKFKCLKHGEFWQTPSNHLMGKSCPKCVNKISKPEMELQEFIKTIYRNVKVNSRSVIRPYELDIYIPSLNKAIEFNGMYWHYHSDHFVPGKHALKSNLCRELGIKLLYIREDLWNKDRNKMKQVIQKFLEK